MHTIYLPTYLHSPHRPIYSIIQNFLNTSTDGYIYIYLSRLYKQLNPDTEAKVILYLFFENPPPFPHIQVLVPGVYRMHFNTAAYYTLLGGRSFYPEVSIDFIVDDTNQHYHVPLLLNPYGYSTYRGS